MTDDNDDQHDSSTTSDGENLAQEAEESVATIDTQTPNFFSLTPSMKANILEHVQPWGRLYSTYAHLEGVDLINDTYKLGRAEDCDIVITERKVPMSHVTAISKAHFILRKSGDTIILHDLSKNGTFINGQLIGKNKSVTLRNDDQISIGYKGLKVFIFNEISSEDLQAYLPPRLHAGFRVSGVLGRGACGEVKLVHDRRTQRRFAVKKIIKDKPLQAKCGAMNHPDRIAREIAILRTLKHPCVVQLLDVEETPLDVFIVLEYMAGGELTSYVEGPRVLGELESKFVFTQIAEGIRYLHSNQIIHRDLKPENILLYTRDVRTSLVKIADFGLSRMLKDYEVYARKTVCGTPMFCAPEVLARRPYGYEVDVWSLGVLLFYMLSRKLPFASGSGRLEERVMRGHYDFREPAWRVVTPAAIKMVRALMRVQPQKRAKVSEIFEHVWLTSDDAVARKVANVIHSHTPTTEVTTGADTTFNSSNAPTSSDEYRLEHEAPVDDRDEDVEDADSLPPAKRSRVASYNDSDACS